MGFGVGSGVGWGNGTSVGVRRPVGLDAGGGKGVHLLRGVHPCLAQRGLARRVLRARRLELLGGRRRVAAAARGVPAQLRLNEVKVRIRVRVRVRVRDGVRVEGSGWG